MYIKMYRNHRHRCACDRGEGGDTNSVDHAKISSK